MNKTIANAQLRTTPSVIIERARVDDLPHIHGLLQRSDLPLDGFEENIATSIVARVEQEKGPGEPGEPGEIVGNATLEVYGPYALLRSVAVDTSLRGQGLGRRLTQAALDLALQLGIQAVYLLTETAADFYPKFGFVHVSRQGSQQHAQRALR